jgi:hypothetical protein
LTVSSINRSIRRPKDPAWKFWDARAEGGWFVIWYRRQGRLLKVYYNQAGREVFQVSREPWYQRVFGERTGSPILRSVDAD